MTNHCRECIISSVVCVGRGAGELQSSSAVRVLTLGTYGSTINRRTRSVDLTPLDCKGLFGCQNTGFIFSLMAFALFPCPHNRKQSHDRMPGSSATARPHRPFAAFTPPSAVFWVQFTVFQRLIHLKHILDRLNKVLHSHSPHSEYVAPKLSMWKIYIHLNHNIVPMFLL